MAPSYFETRGKHAVRRGGVSVGSNSHMYPPHSVSHSHLYTTVTGTLKAKTWTHALPTMLDSHAESKTTCMTPDADINDYRPPSSQPERQPDASRKCLVNTPPSDADGDTMCVSLFKDGNQNPIRLKTSDVSEVCTVAAGLATALVHCTLCNL